MLWSPLEQFEVKIIQPISFFNLFDISITTVSLYLSIIIFFGSFFFFYITKNATIIPHRWQNVVEFIYEFVLSILQQQVGITFFHYFPILFTTFLFILISNLIGLIPFGFTITSHIVITWTLALSFNLAWLFLGFSINGIKFFQLFIPSGISSKFLLSIIVLIEIISYLIRTFSLSVRLFANMMAGHTLLHILSSFGIGFSNSKLPILTLLPFFLVIAVVFLEFGIAIIQAYVFLILVIIYLSDVNSIGSH